MNLIILKVLDIIIFFKIKKNIEKDGKFDKNLDLKFIKLNI